jgi:hypothetical protein
MAKKQQTESQKERNKKGKERMGRYEDGNKVEETAVIKPVEDSSSEYEEYTVTAYQKVDGGDWHPVELTYKRKRR